MTQVKRRSSWLALFIVLGMVLTLTTAPGAVRAADHLDAPGLESPGDDPRLDVNDLLVFEAENEDNTVLVMTVNPAAPGDASFATKQEGSYHLRIDNTGDAIEDITYSFTFKNKDDGQKVKVRRATGESAQSARPRGDVIAQGFVGEAFEVPGGGTVLADLRSDPFFFDLIGFLETVEGMDVDPNRTGLGDGMQTDFFAELNTLAIVLEVPDWELGGNIGVWATTSVRSGTSSQNDRMGRPAINTAVNSSGPIVNAPTENKNVFNVGLPKNDQADFTGAAVAALLAYSDLGTQYTPAEAAALAAVLLPDILTYDTGTAADFSALNGRAPADDVIDTALSIVSNGAVAGDGIGPHTDYLTEFPYLGEAH